MFALRHICIYYVGLPHIHKIIDSFVFRKTGIVTSKWKKWNIVLKMLIFNPYWAFVSSVFSSIFFNTLQSGYLNHHILLYVYLLTSYFLPQNETCRSALCENQQWSLVMVLFGLLSCSVTVHMKGELLLTLAAIAHTPVFASTIWQTLETSQVLFVCLSVILYWLFNCCIP